MAKKQLPFEQIKTQDGAISLPVKEEWRIANRVYDWQTGGMLMSPYSNYIPLSYLFCNMDGWNGGELYPAHFDKIRTDGGCTKWLKGYKNSLFNGFARDSISNAPDRIGALTRMNNKAINWLKNDSVVSINDIRDGVYRDNDRVYVGGDILGSLHNLHQRSYNALSHLYSLYRSTGRDILEPHVLAVVLPENYLYMKYKLLVDGVLDLSRVIILIDKEMDTPRFECKPFRKFYREFLLPKIVESSCDVWNVPLGYIKENCFLGEYSLNGMKMWERKKAIEEIIESFKDSFINSDIQSSAQDSTPTWTNTGLGNVALGYSSGRRVTYSPGSLSLSDLTEAIGSMYTYRDNRYTLGVDPVSDLPGIGNSTFTIDLNGATDGTMWQQPLGVNAASAVEWAEQMLAQPTLQREGNIEF